MKVRFLGTSYGAPCVGRHQQSMLFETKNGDAYLVDVGAPVLDILINDGYDLTKIKAIFITHLHGDHMNGLLDILNLTEYFQMHYKVFLSEQRGITAFQEFSSMQLCSRENTAVSFDLIKEGCFYNDGNLRITAVLTKHMEEAQKPSYGFLLEADGKAVYVTGDLHPTLKDFPAFLEKRYVDMIITECAHFSAQNLCAKLNQCKTDKVAFIHVMPTEKYEDIIALGRENLFKQLLPCDSDEYEI